MAKKTQAGPDPSSPFGDFDPIKLANAFVEMASNFRLPGVDVDAVLRSQRRNMEALAEAGRVAQEGAQAVARRQAELVHESLNEARSALERIAAAGSPQEIAQQQAEYLKGVFESLLVNMRELAEMVGRSNLEASSAIEARLRESLEELKAYRHPEER